MKPMDEAVIRKLLLKSCPDHLYTTIIAHQLALSHNIPLLWELLVIKPDLQHLLKLGSLCVALLSQHYHLFKTMSIVKHRVQLVHTKRCKQ